MTEQEYSVDSIEYHCDRLEKIHSGPYEIPIERIAAIVYRLRAIITAAEQAKERLRETEYQKMEDER